MSAHILIEYNPVLSMIRTGEPPGWDLYEFHPDREIFERFERTCGIIVRLMLWGRIKQMGVRLEP